MDEQLVLLISVVSSSVRHVIENLLLVEVVPLSDWNESLWSESALAVNEHGFTCSTALRARHLAGDAESVAELRLSSSELTEELGDRACLYASTE